MQQELQSKRTKIASDKRIRKGEKKTAREEAKLAKAIKKLKDLKTNSTPDAVPAAASVPTPVGNMTRTDLSGKDEESEDEEEEKKEEESVPLMKIKQIPKRMEDDSDDEEDVVSPMDDANDALLAELATNVFHITGCSEEAGKNNNIRRDRDPDDDGGGGGGGGGGSGGDKNSKRKRGSSKTHGTTRQSRPKKKRHCGTTHQLAKEILNLANLMSISSELDWDILKHKSIVVLRHIHRRVHDKLHKEPALEKDRPHNFLNTYTNFRKDISGRVSYNSFGPEAIDLNSQLIREKTKYDRDESRLTGREQLSREFQTLQRRFNSTMSTVFSGMHKDKNEIAANISMIKTGLEEREKQRNTTTVIPQATPFSLNDRGARGDMIDAPSHSSKSYEQSGYEDHAQVDEMDVKPMSIPEQKANQFIEDHLTNITVDDLDAPFQTKSGKLQTTYNYFSRHARRAGSAIKDVGEKIPGLLRGGTDLVFKGGKQAFEDVGGTSYLAGAAQFAGVVSHPVSSGRYDLVRKHRAGY